MLDSADQRATAVSEDPLVSVPTPGWLGQPTYCYLRMLTHHWPLAFRAHAHPGFPPFQLMPVSVDTLLPIRELVTPIQM